MPNYETRDLPVGLWRLGPAVRKSGVDAYTGARVEVLATPVVRVDIGESLDLPIDADPRSHYRESDGARVWFAEECRRIDISEQENTCL